MDDNPRQEWEARLAEVSRAFLYPATPDLARKAGRRASGLRRLAWAGAALAVLLAFVLAVPSVRAALADFLQVGAVRIFLAQPTATATPTATSHPTPAALSTAAFPATATRLPAETASPTPVEITSVLDLAGETTLADAAARLSFPIRLPAYPAGLGPPQHVFLQDLGGPVLVLAWVEADRPDQVRISLDEFGPDTFAEKSVPQSIEDTTVGGHAALWTTGPYLLQIKNGDASVRRLVNGHVLVWTEGAITYRLESNLPLEEARKIAESLH